MGHRGILFAAFVGASSPTMLHADTFDLGSFCFHAGTGGYEYVGDHADLLGSAVEGESIAKSVATVDLAMLMSQNPGSVISWIRIEDPGNNFYYDNPGADIDLFALSGAPGGLSIEYSYDGSNALYQNMASDQLAREVSEVDFEHGSNDASDLWVSLDSNGSLTIQLSGWEDILGGGGDDTGEDDGGSGGSGGDGDADDGDDDVGDDGGTLDTGGDPDLSSPEFDDPFGDPFGDLDIPLLGSDMGLDFFDLFGFELRFNEIAPTSEWVGITIGFEPLASTVVPGPTALAVLPLAMGLARRRRMR